MTPDLLDVDLTNNRQLVIEASINWGVDWSTEETAVLNFKPTPFINFLSHYSSNQLGSFNLTVYGQNFEDNIKYCYFGTMLYSDGKYYLVA